MGFGIKSIEGYAPHGEEIVMTSELDNNIVCRAKEAITRLHSNMKELSQPTLADELPRLGAEIGVPITSSVGLVWRENGDNYGCDLERTRGVFFWLKMAGRLSYPTIDQQAICWLAYTTSVSRCTQLLHVYLDKGGNLRTIERMFITTEELVSRCVDPRAIFVEINQFLERVVKRRRVLLRNANRLLSDLRKLTPTS